MEGKVHGRHEMNGLKERAHTELLGQTCLTLSIGMLGHGIGKRILGPDNTSYQPNLETPKVFTDFTAKVLLTVPKEW